jgi:hypothetical protein
MRQLYVKRLHPRQLELHICGNIWSNNSFVNQAEMPLPLGSGHPELSAAHFCVGADSPRLVLEEFGLEEVKSATIPGGTLTPVEASAFPSPRRED